MATIAAIAATISYGFIIEPFLEANSKLNRRIDAERLRLEKSQALLKKQDTIKAEHERYAGFIKPSASDEEEQASMLKAIEAIARSNNIYIKNIRPQPVKEKLFYKEFVFELIAEAEIDRLVKFIYQLQSSENLLRVKKLTLSASSSKKALKALMEITKPSIIEVPK